MGKALNFWLFWFKPKEQCDLEKLKLKLTY